MNWASWVLWGFVATIVLTTISAGSPGSRTHSHQFSLHAGHHVYSQSRPRQALWLPGARGNGMDIFCDIRIHFPGSGSGGVVARRTHRHIPRNLRAGRRHVIAARIAPTHGKRTTGPFGAESA